MSVEDFIRSLPVFVILTVSHFSGVLCEYCGGNLRCDFPEKCCSNGMTCCSDTNDHFISYKLHVWNMWYFWFIIIFIMMSCFGGCGYYRRKRMAAMTRLQQRQRQGAVQTSVDLHRGRHRGQHQAYLAYTGPGMEPDPSYLPPPYSEVVSQPDMYPPNKSELPPYPGAPIITADQHGTSSLPLSAHHLSSQIPQPPPYSEAVPINRPFDNSSNNAQQASGAVNQLSASSNLANHPSASDDQQPRTSQDDQARPSQSNQVPDSTNQVPPV